MKWADAAGVRLQAQRGLRAKCPLCGGDVLSKCGDIISWHWAHKTKDCDSWSEPESDWHRGWKDSFPAQMQEVTIGPHRADVQAPRGIVEFQRSSISTAEIKKREDFYGRMVWVVDASDFWLSSYGRHEELLPEGTARWLWMRKSWLAASKPVYFDRGDGDLLQIKSIDRNGFVDYSLTTKRAFVEQWTGLLNPEKLLTPWTHPLYAYMKNPSLHPRRPELGPNHAVWLQEPQ